MEYLNKNEFDETLKKLQTIKNKDNQLDELIKLYLNNIISLKEFKSFCLFLELQWLN